MTALKDYRGRPARAGQTLHLWSHFADDWCLSKRSAVIDHMRGTDIAVVRIDGKIIPVDHSAVLTIVDRATV